MTQAPVARAVVVAGGRGLRLGGPEPKQFQALGGRPLLVYSLEAIAAAAPVAEIVLVLPAAELPREIDELMARGGIGERSVALRRAIGGRRRQDSVAAGLAALSGPCDVALVHDAARPFPPVSAIEQAIAEAVRVGAAMLALPVSDTVKRADAGGRVAETLDRNGLWLAQTPQAFRGDFIAAMIDLFKGSREFTDESAALEALGVDVALVEGSAANFKVTRAEDLARARAMLASDRGFRSP